MNKSAEYFIIDINYYKTPCRHIEMESVPRIKGIRWLRGQPFTIPVPEPLKLNFSRLNRNHPEMSDRVLNFMDAAKFPIFSDKLISSLRSFGVDNFETYNLEIYDPDSNKVYSNYKAVNILGLLKAADMDKSTYTISDGIPLVNVEFEELHIDPNKTHDFKLFRLAEKLGPIFIHEKLKRYLESCGFDEIVYYVTSEAAI
ncbi:MAG: hypothetical protein JW982_16780 [Spirochaetes bacterium]|nr:hypothetical protein [Spirochaetota bacterium]